MTILYFRVQGHQAARSGIFCHRAVRTIWGYLDGRRMSMIELSMFLLRYSTWIISEELSRDDFDLEFLKNLEFITTNVCYADKIRAKAGE